MNENGGISSTYQGLAEAVVRQPLIPPGPKPDETVLVCRRRHITPGLSDNVYLKTMLVVTVTGRYR